MVIQHNLAALNAHRNLGINNKMTNSNLEKLSSGFRINRAADDAAGLAISEKMRGQIRGLAMAETNVSNGIQLIQTAEGGLNETHAILHRMRELAVQASNGTYVDEDRQQIELEFQALKSEIDRIASSTHYNGINMLDGSVGGLDYVASGATILGVEIFDSGAAVLDATGFDMSGFDDAEATLIVRRDGTLALQFADKTFFSGTSTTVSGKEEYTFQDMDGNTFTLTLEASPVNTETVVTGLKFSYDDTDPDKSSLSVEAGVTRAAGPASELIFQIGANGGADQQVGLHVENMASGNIGDKANNNYLCATTVVTRQLANDAIKVIDDATNQVSSQRAELGALQNRMEHTLNNLGVTKENLTAAESTIRDVDMAKEMMEFTKNSILVQAAQSMLAQANSLPQGVLSLLQ